MIPRGARLHWIGDGRGGRVCSLERAAALSIAHAVRLGALAAGVLAALSRVFVTAAVRAAEGQRAWTRRARATLDLAPPTAAVTDAQRRTARLARLGRLVTARMLASLAAAVADAEGRTAWHRALLAMRLLAPPAAACAQARHV